jgi:hypothetical protein
MRTALTILIALLAACAQPGAEPEQCTTDSECMAMHGGDGGPGDAGEDEDY